MKPVVWFLVFCLLLSALPVLAQCPSADLTGDCFVDLSDLAVLSQWWLDTCDPNDDCQGVDLLVSGAVDIDDLTAMISLWQTGNRLPDDMVLIPGGTFQMGDSFGEGELEELPLHTVTVSSFYMCRYEITNRQYCGFLNSVLEQNLITVMNGVIYNPSLGIDYPYCNIHAEYPDSQINYSGEGFSVNSKGERDMSNDPMVDVSWYGAVAYCNWQSEQEGRETCYDLSTWECDFSKNGYHLPTEAQWEYAARGDLWGRRFPWGDTITHNQANYFSIPEYVYDISMTSGFHPMWHDTNEPYTSPVGNFPSNGYGLNDMAGNVWEWCNDWYIIYDSGAQTNPIGSANGTDHVFRGGSWGSDAYGCRVARRYGLLPDCCYFLIGFRVSIGLD
ncbi:MAG: formylglycine-generating enzyme family protein [Sedimentisphaerales bacterium]|nr:formylglycine-generating enzyme family protein [Sedimentisphaerales bacterium]